MTMKEEKIYRQEAVVPDRGLPFKLFRFEGADGKYICEAHQHSSVEIFALREGKVDFCLGDKKYVLPAGKFIIVNSNEVHSIHTSGRNEAIVLQIPMEKQIMRFSGEKKEEDGKLFALLEKMYRQQIRKEYGYELLMQSIFYQLKYLLVTAYRIPEEKKDYYPGNTHSGHLERITGYLREHYAEEISLETLAATFGYCPTYLSKMFRQYGRINYKDYLRSIRFEHALRELEETDLTIGEIALKNGFPNSQAFSRLFREKYGILPTEYQRRQKENDSAAFLMIQIQAESSLLGRL
ncbi:AraC family transcriptional regulator [Waltera sp.]|uniref:AraC family transcriptional regulator n=1 Tax=Waltera sp. TaxID=2815806 RepID=UPI0039906066